MHAVLQGVPSDSTPGRKRSRPTSAETVHPKDGVSEDATAEPASQRPRLTQAPSQQDAQAGSTPSEMVPIATSEAGVSFAPGEHATAEADSLVVPIPSPGAAYGMSPAPVAEAPGPAGNANAQDQQGFGDAADVGREGAGLIAAVSAEGNQKMEEHFQPSIPMQEMVVNFLLRMAFVIGGDKEHEAQVSV